MDVKSQIKNLLLSRKQLKVAIFEIEQCFASIYSPGTQRNGFGRGINKGRKHPQSYLFLPENSLYVNPSLSLKLENTDLEEDKVLDKIKLSSGVQFIKSGSKKMF